MDRNTTGNIPVVPEQRLAITLRFLAGGQALDLLDMAAVSLCSVYQIVWSTVAAINNCKAIDLPDDLDDPSVCATRAADFQRRSAVPDAFKGCVGAIDGLFIRIIGRSAKQVKNPRAFYSGHKKGYGVNLQVVCDAFCRVIAAACNTPGCTNDYIAYNLSHIRRIVDNIPEGYYIVGDPAYPLSDRLLISYSGTTTGVADGGRDNYNYFHSQLRITVERTFGQIVNRWGILWTPMQFSLPRIASIISAILRLHNFGINWGLRNGKTFTFRGQKWLSPVQFQPCSPLDPDGQAIGDERFQTVDTTLEEVAKAERILRRMTRDTIEYGSSEVREGIRDTVADLQAVRPKENERGGVIF